MSKLEQLIRKVGAVTIYPKLSGYLVCWQTKSKEDPETNVFGYTIEVAVEAALKDLEEESSCA